MSNKTVWERTSVQSLLRNGSSGRYYARWTLAGKQKWLSLDTDVFTVAKLRLNDEAAKIEKLRGSHNAVTAGKGVVGDFIAVYVQRTDANADLKPASKVARLVALKKLI